MVSRHYLTGLAERIDETHPHLGEPAAVAMLTIKCKKLLMLVSPRGCGKSRVTSFIGLSSPEHLLCDRLSVAGLVSLQDSFNNFNGVVVVDDIAKTQTPYARIATLTTLAELIYSHYCISHLSGATFDIQGFNGAGVVNVQPVLLRELVKSPEWEASLQDKSLRYYHLHRPLEPNPLPPDFTPEWGIDIEKIERPKLTGKAMKKLLNIGEIQWGLARLQEHISDLLRAAAALDGREEVTALDVKLLSKLLMPMQIESLVFSKYSLESDRNLASDQLAILTEFVTYGNFTLRQLSRDYKLSQSQCYRIMGKYPKDWVVVEKEPTVYAPSDELKEKLREVGIK